MIMRGLAFLLVRFHSSLNLTLQAPYLRYIALGSRESFGRVRHTTIKQPWRRDESNPSSKRWRRSSAFRSCHIDVIVIPPSLTPNEELYSDFRP
ncbi:hypothetical protein BDV12DRAFT_161207 [Aspergillus spectabilis]